jgi:hypothetical protein
MGGPVQDYRRIPPGLRISTTRNDEDISGVPYLAIPFIKPRSLSRPASPTLQCPITHPLGEGKHSRFILSNTLIRIMYQTRSLL